jgi:hypothetical protein
MTNNKEIKFLSSIRPIVLVGLSLITIGLVCLSGCGSGANSVTSTTGNSCTALDGVSQLTGTEETCCCNGTNALNPPPSSCSGSSFTCPLGPAGLAATAGTLNDAAQAYNTGVAASGAAGSLLSSSSPVKNSAPGVGTAAATSGGISSIASPTPTTPLGAAIQPAAIAGSAPPAGMGGIGSGGLTSLSGTPTAAAVPFASASPSLAMGPDAGYYVSGGTGLSPGKADLFGLGASGDSNSVPGAGKSEKDFGGERAPSSSSDAMGSADPADYFSRLNAGDNIFKIVERKYIDESKQWAMADAEALSRSARSASTSAASKKK